MVDLLDAFEGEGILRAVPTVFLALTALAVTSTASAAPEGIDLARPGGKALRILGETGDNAAYTVARVGDVNGDGIEDIAVGAPYADYAKRKDAGAVFVIFGRRPYRGVDLHLFDVRGGGFRIDGAHAGDHFGAAVSGGQDLDGDGYADIVVGAPRASFFGRRGSGVTYVIHGGPRNGALDLEFADPSVYDEIGGRSPGDASGTSVAATGDTDGDGVPDVLVGAPGADGRVRNYPTSNTNTGAAFVVRWQRGRHPGAPVDLAQSATGQVLALDGELATEKAGTAVADAGLVDADERHEVLVGAPGGDRNQRIDSGSAFVVSPGRLTGDRNLSQLAGIGYRIDGMSDGARFGAAVAGVGDVNGDGVADQVVGAPGAAFGRRYGAGRSVVVFGQQGVTPVDTRSLGNGGFQIVGAAYDDQSGSSVAPAGDFNGDGLADVIVGAPEADDNCRGGSGSAYVVYGKFGRAPVILSDEEPDQGFQINGANPGDRVGFSVADVGGFAGGGPGVLAGGYSVQAPRPNAGAAYVVTGAVGPRPSRRYRTRLPLKILKKPGGTASDYGGYLSVPVLSTDGDIRDVFAGAYTFGGRRIGSVALRRLRGRTTLNIKLTERLRSGGVSVVISGQPAPSRYCGPKTKTLVLKFR
jgi:hypothetical protein